MGSKFKFSMWIVAVLLAGCSDQTEQPADQAEDALTQILTQPLPNDNPFAGPSPLPFNYPQFDRIAPEHFLPAFAHGIAEQAIEIEAIAFQAASPTFANTIAAMELSGQTLNRTSAVFDNFVLAVGGDQLLAIQQQIVPLLAAHDHQIVRNRALFQRIEHLFETRVTLALDEESLYLLENYYQSFVIAGAGLASEDQYRLDEINAELELLQTIYSDNSVEESRVLAASLELSRYGIDILQPPTDQEFLADIEYRQLRREIHEAALSRGSNANEYNNRQLLSQILMLRAEKAALLGFENYAEMIASQQSVRTTRTIDDLLGEIAPFVNRAVERDAKQLQELIDTSGKDFNLAAWDWRYYESKKRALASEPEDGGFNLKPYLDLTNVLNNGVFFAAGELYGITFRERTDLPVYHEDVQVFEVFDTVGTSLGIFIADYFSRPGKMSGAWSNSYVSQSELLRNQAVVANHLNIEKPANGQGVLLTFDEVETIFHEFGHALQSLFSEVRYPYFSGSRVVEDFVEYAGLVNEMWATYPSVVDNYAVHFETGEPLPDAEKKALLARNNSTQSYKVAEVLESAMLDQALHQLDLDALRSGFDYVALEESALPRTDLPTDLVPPRYSGHYFLHIMGGFAASYYSYVLGDILEADTRQWFSDNGGLIRNNGDLFRRLILSKGGARNGLDLYNEFRGAGIDTSAYLNAIDVIQ